MTDKDSNPRVSAFHQVCYSLKNAASAFIRVHPSFFKNRQTLSAKLGLPNNIGYLCHQFWQKFIRHEKLAKVNSLRSELSFSAICFGAPYSKVRKAQPHFRTRIARIFTDMRFLYDVNFQIYDAVRHESTSINYMILQGR